MGYYLYIVRVREVTNIKVPCLKVVHIITTIDLGGAENQLALLSQLQSERRMKVIIIPLKEMVGSEKPNFGPNVKIYNGVRNRNPMFQVISLIRYLRKADPDVLHAHLPRAELISALVVRILKRFPLICTKHNSERFWHSHSKFISRKLSLFVERQAAGTICISKSVEKYLIETTKELENLEKCHVIYYGYEKVGPAKRGGRQRVFKTEDATNHEDYRIVTVARLVPQKNLEKLIYAMLNLKPSNITLDIYGDGPLRENLSSLIQELNLENRVKLMSKTSSIQKIYPAYDVFVLPSKYEGLGLALLEAIDFHLRIAVSKIDTFEEILGEDFPFFFNNDSSHDIANTINRSALDSTFDRALFAKTILDRFNPSEMYAEVEKVYLTYVQGK